MSANKYIILVIIGCSVATWLSRVTPFILLRRTTLSDKVMDFFSFVPVVIMSALWFNSLFEQQIGHLPTLNTENLLASIPTVLSAILSKNLLIIVITGIVSLAAVRLLI